MHSLDYLSPLLSARRRIEEACFLLRASEGYQFGLCLSMCLFSGSEFVSVESDSESESEYSAEYQC
jgi:hypothetical protein